MNDGDYETRRFWRDAFALKDSATPMIVRRVIKFGAISLLITAIHPFYHPEMAIEVAPYEVAGAALGLLLVLRTNAGYDRWWEGRKLWGGIVNQSRNLAISALAYGPDDREWRDRLVRWTAAFSHVARRSLRKERALPEVAALLGEEDAARIAEAEHMPSFVALAIGERLRFARDRMGMDPFGFLQVDRERATLIDHIGACERIVSAPLPRAYTINIRRFILLYLTTLPFALLDKIGWLTPLVTILVAYPILSLDQIGIELQNPFKPTNLGHLPLDDLSNLIEKNLLSLLKADPGSSPDELDRLPDGLAGIDKPRVGTSRGVTTTQPESPRSWRGREVKQEHQGRV